MDLIDGPFVVGKGSSLIMAWHVMPYSFVLQDTVVHCGAAMGL